MIAPCGADCAACELYGNLCKEGCSACKGHVFHAPEGEACPLYACPVEKHGYTNCGECGERPCALWRATRDPNLSDEAFEQTITDRLANLAAPE